MFKIIGGMLDNVHSMIAIQSNKFNLSLTSRVCIFTMQHVHQKEVLALINSLLQVLQHLNYAKELDLSSSYFFLFDKNYYGPIVLVHNSFQIHSVVIGRSSEYRTISSERELFNKFYFLKSCRLTIEPLISGVGGQIVEFY